MSQNALDRARDRSTSPEELAALAAHEYWLVRWEVAENPNTPATALIKLAEELADLAADESWGIRQHAARNRNTPVEVLAELAADEDSYVRMWVAWNPKTPVEALSVLAADEDLGVLKAVTRNPSSPALARRTAFFSVLTEQPTGFDDTPWTPQMTGITEEEWALANSLAAQYRGRSEDLDQLCRSVFETADHAAPQCLGLRAALSKAGTLREYEHSQNSKEPTDLDGGSRTGPSPGRRKSSSGLGLLGSGT